MIELEKGGIDSEDLATLTEGLSESDKYLLERFLDIADYLSDAEYQQLYEAVVNVLTTVPDVLGLLGM